MPARHVAVGSLAPISRSGEPGLGNVVVLREAGKIRLIYQGHPAEARRVS